MGGENVRRIACFFAGMAILAGAMFTPLVLPSVGQAFEVDPEIPEAFATSEKAAYIIHFRAKANLTNAPRTDWREQNEFINRALQENANRSQARVQSYLFGRRVPYRSSWRDNTITVESSDRDTFEGLGSFSEIEAIRLKKDLGSDPTKTAPKEGGGSVAVTK